ncbi:hypothetical protein I6H48_04370 [Corynebacterium amycolatum]|uniref:Uncharacterized protein n=1 Tax=Corynebacterium amycolatum TaxID=43765 RepID=A0AB37GET9_CORAY|nr:MULTISPECIES: hypothetical protein [Corynebacterium]OFM13539.1 hypothetical protein HMPREF2714_07450 [Corynebacterium sp. HMSC077G01]QPR31569.1 hypothetical protein I6G95_03790 [Corynebacterium amycolatum]QQB83449.1 hypothetical protein I6H48_04370 [Corynebacterium amycolatum]
MTEDHQEPLDTNQETDAAIQETDIPTSQEDTPANQEAEDTATGQAPHIAELEKRLKSANSEAATRRQKQREAEARIEELEAEVERIHQERREELIARHLDRIGFPTAPREMFPGQGPLEDIAKDADKIQSIAIDLINDWLEWDRSDIEHALRNRGFSPASIKKITTNIYFLTEIGFDRNPDWETITEAIKAYQENVPSEPRFPGEMPYDGSPSTPSSRVMTVFDKKR